MASSSGKRSNPIDIVEIDDSSEDDDDVQIIEPHAAGWLYVGSHNFTPSAWYVYSIPVHS
jgi:hypothetical protein